MAAIFRTCAHTGLKVHNQAERLIKVHAVAGVLAILFGGIAALLVLLTRWPAVHLLLPGAHVPRHQHAHLLDHLL
ncbi:MAG: cytochrome c oxidase subunit I [candidate division NC10 bacterium]|nr:cytochrome c oxidase subunit I [candidate division NC10 bacterium]